MIKGISTGLTFAFFFLLARWMTPTEYGQFGAAISLATIAGFLATMGQHSVVSRFYPALDETSGPALAWAAARSAMTTTFIGAVLALALGALIAISPARLEAFGSSPAVYAGIGALTAGFATSEVATAILRARRSIVLALVPREVLWRPLTLAAVFLAVRPISAGMTVAAAAIALVFVTAFQYLKIYKAMHGQPRVPIPEADKREMTHAARGLWAVSGVDLMIQHGTVILVGLLVGPAAAGAYFACDRLAKMLSIALIGVQQIVGPMFARSYFGGRISEVKTIARLSSLVSFSVAAAGYTILLLFGSNLLALFDPAYTAAFPILMFLATGQLVNTACGPNTLILNMLGQERRLLRILTGWCAIGFLAITGAGIFLGLKGVAAASMGMMIGWNIQAYFAAIQHLRTDRSGSTQRLDDSRGKISDLSDQDEDKTDDEAK
ncbi:lipopolysaccharide biosynthesis protein [Palleronia sp.]|uniref:lipopolysaccharide biosynthesis protein n=1 Tax=Palleronia sp. TaxID=1940284 RepID=UPI0035C7DD5B